MRGFQPARRPGPDGGARLGPTSQFLDGVLYFEYCMVATPWPSLLVTRSADNEV